MKLSVQSDPQPQPSASVPLMLEAVVRQRCVSATYNRTRMVLAPHILFTRAGQLYVDALVVARENMLPREDKIGTFKLDGLKDLALLERPFEINALFDPSLEKYQGVTLMKVEPGAA